MISIKTINEQGTASIVIIVVVMVAVGVVIAVISSGNNSQPEVEQAVESVQQEQKNEQSYADLSSFELAGMLLEKDFTLVDVHISEQEHIPGTDEFIPYNEIEKIVGALPDKNAKIVLYCRSGNMSGQVADALAQRGYTDVSHLSNGLKEWVAEGREVSPIGSL